MRTWCQRPHAGSWMRCATASRWHGDTEISGYREAGGLSDQLRDTTGFLYEIGLLKRYKRTGWSLAGVPAPESVADHSFRASVIASVIAAMEGADPQRAAFLRCGTTARRPEPPTSRTWPRTMCPQPPMSGSPRTR